MIAQASLLSLHPLSPKSSQASVFERLRGVDLFNPLSDGDLLKLSAGFRERRVAKGELIVRQDEGAADHLFLLLEGQALVIREDSEGEESLLAALRPGDVIGGAELFDENPHYASVRASSPCRLLSLRREQVLGALKERPEWALGLLGELARRLRLCNRRLTGLSHQKVPRRVACVLVSLLDENGVRLRDAQGRRCALLNPRPAQRQIAGLAGIARETVSRLFTQWEQAGWLEDRKGGLMVYDEAGLRRMAGEE